MHRGQGGLTMTSGSEADRAGARQSVGGSKNSSTDPDDDGPGETRLKGLAGLSPGFFLAVNMLELVVLLLLAVAWQWQWRGFHHDQLPAVLWGCLPIAVPWA